MKKIYLDLTTYFFPHSLFHLFCLSIPLHVHHDFLLQATVSLTKTKNNSNTYDKQTNKSKIPI